jgi:DNA-binding GntR family transcriptional regulator
MQKQYSLEKLSDFQLLKDKVYETIKRNIINLSFPPHAQLIEQRLAEELGVSKSPIREALLRLEKDGLVYTLPFKGSFVSGITIQDAREIFQLREALETFCVKLACEKFSEVETQKAREILSTIKEALLHDDFERSHAIHIRFHNFLISESKNERIIQTYLTLSNHLDRYRKIASLISGRIAKSYQEHLLIIEAIERKDELKAERAVSEHLRSLLNDFINSKELQSFCADK